VAEHLIEENDSSAIVGSGIEGSTCMTEICSNFTLFSSDETHKKYGDPSKSSSSGSKNKNNKNKNSNPSIGRSLRKGMFPQALLREIHEFDDRPLFGGNSRRDNGDNEGVGSSNNGGKWLERLGYHVYKQGFPNNLDNLPPIPVLKITSASDTDSLSGSMAINVQDVSLELRPRDSPYGRNMRRWRRKRTANDTEPFPTI
jgi:hypothetical protein